MMNHSEHGFWQKIEAYRAVKSERFKRIIMLSSVIAIVLLILAVLFALNQQFSYLIGAIFAGAILWGALYRSGQFYDLRMFRRFEKRLPEIKEDPLSIVWVYFTEGHYAGQTFYHVILADSTGKKLILPYDKNREGAVELVEAAQEVFPLCVFNHYLTGKLDTLYKQMPGTFYLYAKRLTMPKDPLPRLTLKDARQVNLPYVDPAPPSQSAFFPKDGRIRFILGCAARFTFTESAYDLYERTKDVPRYQQALPQFFEEIYYSLDFVRHRYPKPMKDALKQESRDMMHRDWGISNRAELIHMLNWLLESGHRLEFNLRMIEPIRAEFPNVVSNAGFDIARYVNLVRDGFAADFIRDATEATEYLEKAYSLFIRYFDNYDAFVDSYLVGVYAWNPTYYDEILQSVCYAYLNPYCPWNREQRMQQAVGQI